MYPNRTVLDLINKTVLKGIRNLKRQVLPDFKKARVFSLIGIYSDKKVKM